MNKKLLTCVLLFILSLSTVFASNCVDSDDATQEYILQPYPTGWNPGVIIWGANWFVKGTATFYDDYGHTTQYTDYCFNSTVQVEALCILGEYGYGMMIINQTQSTPMVCVDGALVPVNQNSQVPEFGAIGVALLIAVITVFVFFKRR